MSNAGLIQTSRSRSLSDTAREPPLTLMSDSRVIMDDTLVRTAPRVVHLRCRASPPQVPCSATNASAEPGSDGVCEDRVRRQCDKPKAPDSSRTRPNTDTLCRCSRFSTPGMSEAGHEHPASPASSLVGDEGFEPPTSSISRYVVLCAGVR